MTKKGLRILIAILVICLVAVSFIALSYAGVFGEELAKAFGAVVESVPEIGEEVGDVVGDATETLACIM